MNDTAEKKLVSLTGASRFEAAMAVRPCARTAHFFAHHLAHHRVPAAVASEALSELSTALVHKAAEAVDELHELHLGLVVPKRHAKRSVTRSLVKRQIRSGMRQCAHLLAAGDWVLRLRAPLDRKVYTSACSDALADLVRAEIVQLLADAARRAPRQAKVP